MVVIQHRNLKFILVTQSGAIILVGLFRFTMIVVTFGSGDIFYVGLPLGLQQATTFANSFRNTLGHIILLERVIATVLANRYEAMDSPFFTIVWFVLTVGFCFGNSLGTLRIIVFFPNFSSALPC